MSLDPNAWEYEQNPARLQKDLDRVKMPWGTTIPQPQDPTDLENKYKGVHLTNSDEIAAMYANGKATRDDPPVIVEIDPIELKKQLDVDASFDYALDGYIGGRKSDWQKLLQEEDPEVISETFRENLDSDLNFADWGDEIQDPADIIMNKERACPPSLILDYIGDKNDEQTVQILRDIVSDNIPIEMHMSSVNQFKVLDPIHLDRIKGIYQVPFVNLSKEGDLEYLDTLTAEQLAEEGVTKVGDEYLDEEGRQMLGYDEMNYGWISYTPLYENKQAYFEGMSSQESVWHGTTLSRVRQAFPELFSGNT